MAAKKPQDVPAHYHAITTLTAGWKAYTAAVKGHATRTAAQRAHAAKDQAKREVHTTGVPRSEKGA